MKGVVADCLAELVITNFGRDKWEKILERSGLTKTTHFPVVSDVDDDAIFAIIGITCDVLGITPKQAFDAFGDYWVSLYTRKVYWAYYFNVKTARDLFTKLDYIHEGVTRRIKNAKPPRFDYAWQDDNTLVMTYKSERNLIDLFESISRSVATFYKEDLDISKLDDKRLRIIFPDSQ